MPNAVVASNANGDYAIGVEIEGVFVPAVVIAAHRVAHEAERQENLAAAANDGHEPAKDALAQGFVVAKPSRQKSGAKASDEDVKDGES